MQKAIFLDRDGTINVDSGYVYKTEDCILLDEAKEGLSLLKDLGYLLIIVTNQSGIGRGLYTLDDAHLFHRELERQLGFAFHTILLCPHTPEDRCLCRKPQTASVTAIREQFDINLSESYFIGDRASDIECWHHAGCTTVYIQNETYAYDSPIRPDYTVQSILEFARGLEK